jgi:Pyruvate/2-oxoacid:ferredoxin oxidoreductase delta subunit/flavodoxin
VTSRIYYFTGTGNSLAVARSIAERIGSELVPVAATVAAGLPASPADVLGFVFPVYDFLPAPLVTTLLERMPDLSGSYVFAVGTYGFVPQKAMESFAAGVVARGGLLAGGFLLRMPHNGLGGVALSRKREQALFDRARERCEDIAAYVSDRRTGTIERVGYFGGLVVTGRIFGVIPKVVPILYNAATNGWESFAYFADDRCDGCGICARVCPAANVQMDEGRPRWLDHCALCFACLHWCPREAVQAGKVTVGMRRYHHPAVKLPDILRQKELSAG